MDTFPKKINLFKIEFEGEKKIFKYDRIPETENENNFCRRGNVFFSPLKVQNAEETDFNPSNILKIIDAEFRNKLMNNEYEFSKKYSVYKKKEINPNKEIFSLFDGFAYRFVSLENDLFLVIDYKLIVKSNASIQELFDLNAPKEVLINNSVEFRDVNGDKKNGKLIEANSNECVVDFYGSDIESVPSNSIYPLCRPEVLRHILKSMGKRVNVVLMQRQKSLLNSRRRLPQIKKIVETLNSESIFPLSIGEMELKITNDFLPLDEIGYSSYDLSEEETEFANSYDGLTLKYDDPIVEPNLQFDTGYYNQKPLPTNYPPYLRVEKLSIALYYPETKNEQLNILSKGVKRYLEKYYYVENIEIHKYPTTFEPNNKEYIEEIQNSVKFNKDNVDLGIIYVPESMKYRQNSPYYSLKAYFASVGIPTQMVTEKSFSPSNYSINFTWINMCTAIIAKCGGIPWVLKTKLKETDIIIGMSFSSRLSNIGENIQKHRYVGFANIFDEYGKWFYFCGTANQYSKDAELEQITEIIRDIKKYYSQSTRNSPKNIIIHSSKRVRYQLRKQIYNLLKEEFGQNCNCCFVIIDETHNYRCFDISSRDGSLPRGYYVYLKNNEILLSTTGFSVFKGPRIGSPVLLHITAYQYPKKFLNLEDIANQVLSLTKLNWASVTPVQREPVTINYANRLAKIAANIGPDKWDSINFDILYNKPWFI